MRAGRSGAAGRLGSGIGRARGDGQVDAIFAVEDDLAVGGVRAGREGDEEVGRHLVVFLFGGFRFFGLFFAGGFEALELLVGSEEGALEASGDLREAVEHGGVGHGIGGFVVGAGFEGFGADEFPLGDSGLVDEVLFGGVLRVVLILEAAVKLVELFAVFVGEDGSAGAQSVAERVEGGGGFALRGNRSRRFRCVAAVGRDLFLCCHRVT